MLYWLPSMDVMCQWRQLTSGLFDGVLNRGYWVIPRLNLHMLCTFLYPIRHVGKRVFRARTYLNVPPKTSLTIPSYNPWMYLHSNGETQPENLRRSLKIKKYGQIPGTFGNVLKVGGLISAVIVRHTQYPRKVSHKSGLPCPRVPPLPYFSGYKLLFGKHHIQDSTGISRHITSHTFKNEDWHNSL